MSEARFPRTRRRTALQRLGLVGIGLLVVPVALVLVEGALTLSGVGPDRFEDPFIGFDASTDLFVEAGGADGRRILETAPNKLEFFNLQRFPAEKGADTFRVFTLGGSTTAGRPYDDHVSFSRWLERYLDAAEPDRRHEVINAGAISYASYRIVLLMRELVRYSPDLFVIYTGHNEFLEERTYRGFVGQPAALRWLRTRFARFRFARLAWSALEDAERSGESELEAEVKTRFDVWTGIDGFVRDDELARSILEHFDFNLDQMIAIAGAHDIPVILVAPVSNLKDFSPFKSEHRAQLSDAGRERFARLLGEGRERLQAGEAEAALEHFQEAAELDSEFAEIHFRLGQARLSLGQAEAAQAAFLQAKELDVAPLRALESIVASIRRQADLSRLPLIDLPRLLESRARGALGHPILGNEFLLDHVHPKLQIHSLIAEEIVRILTENRSVRASAWSEERRQAIFQRVVDDLDHSYYGQRDLNLGKVLGWSGKIEEAKLPLLRAAEAIPGNADLHLQLGTLYQETGRLQQAEESFERAIRLGLQSAQAFFHLGVVKGQRGSVDEGIEDLREAIRLRPEYPEAHYNLGLLLQRAGRTGEAVAALEVAAQQGLESADSLRAAGRAYRAQGRLEEALRSFRASLDRDPDSVSTVTELGVTLAAAGRHSEAQTTFERALEIDPRRAEGYYNLGLLYAQSGLVEKARASYRRVLEIDPDHIQALNNLGILLARGGKRDEARRLLERAVERAPDNAEAHLNLGAVHDQSGRAGLAIAAVERALELRPDDPRIRLALGMLYIADQRAADAKPHLEAARAAGQQLPPEIDALLERLP